MMDETMVTGPVSRLPMAGHTSTRRGSRHRRRLAFAATAVAAAVVTPAIGLMVSESSASAVSAAGAGTTKEISLYGSNPNDMKVEARQLARRFCGGDDFYFVRGLYNGWTLTADKGWHLEDTAVCV
jgi:hypothetical protein